MTAGSSGEPGGAAAGRSRSLSPPRCSALCTRSSPPQKPLPLPLSSSTWTAGSRSARSTAATSSATSAGEIPLPRSGRLSVSRATRPSTAYSTAAITRASGVAPGGQLAQCAQVVAVAVAAHAEDQVLHAGLDQGVGLFDDPAAHAPGALDLGRVAAHVGAVAEQDVVLGPVGLRVAEAVPHVGVLGDELQRHLGAAAADEDRQVAQRRRVELAQAVLDP